MLRVRQFLAYEPLARPPRGDYWRSLVPDGATTRVRRANEAVQTGKGSTAIDMIAMRLQSARLREADWDLFSARQARVVNGTSAWRDSSWRYLDVEREHGCVGAGV